MFMVPNSVGPHCELTFRTALKLLLHCGTLRDQNHRSWRCCISRPAFSAIRRISGFRTVSDEAVLVLAKTMPKGILADILSLSRVSRTNSHYKSGGTKDFHPQMAVTVGNILRRRWTFHLVPYITPWIENEHCELNYYVAQFLTAASGSAFTDLDMTVPLHAQTA